MRSCSTCRWHQPIEDDNGECRAALPVAMQSDDTETRLSAEWPHVLADDWCGAYEPIRATLGQPIRYAQAVATRLTPGSIHA